MSERNGVESIDMLDAEYPTAKEKAEYIEFVMSADSYAADLIQSLMFHIGDKYCPESEGWEGPDTFPECGKCWACAANLYLSNRQGLAHRST